MATKPAFTLADLGGFNVHDYNWLYFSNFC